MKAFLKNIWKSDRKCAPITIVSGLPRSGTSMMMRMLEAGGMPVITDNLRRADENNPRGYYEFEKVKQLKKDSSWVSDCQGKALKVVSALVYELPQNLKYKLILMKRDMRELLASQKTMLNRLGREPSPTGDDAMSEYYRTHLENLEQWLGTQDNMEVLSVSYNEAISTPHECVKRLNRFLGGGLNSEAMTRVVELALYRQRK